MFAFIARILAGSSSHASDDQQDDAAYQGSNSIQEFIERHFAHPDVSRRCWRLLWQAVALGASLAATGIYGCFYWRVSFWLDTLYLLCFAAGMALMGTAKYVTVRCKVIIPAMPKSIGVLNIWNKRQPVLLYQGNALLFDFPPFNMSASIEDVTSIPLEFEYDDVLCGGSPDPLAQPGTVTPKTGGEVYMKVALKGTPDTSTYERYNTFINLTWAKIIPMMRDQIGAELKDVAIRYAQESVLTMGKSLSIMLLSRISEVDFHEVPVDGNGAIDPPLLKTLTLKKYEQFPYIADPVAFLNPDVAGVSAQELQVLTKSREQEILAFEKVTGPKDLADIKNLGVRIGNLSIPKIKQDKVLEEASDEASAATKRTEAVRRRVEGQIANARIVVNASRPTPKSNPTISLKEALRNLRIDEGDAFEIVLPEAAGDYTRGAAVNAAATNRKKKG